MGFSAMKSSGSKRQQGSAMVMVLVAVMLLGTVGGTLAALSATELAISNEYQKGVAAQYLAEAGAMRAIVKLKSDEIFIAQTANGTGYTITGTLNEGTYTAIVKGSESNRIIVATGAAGTGKKATRQVVVSGRIISNAGGGMTRFFLPDRWTNVPPL